MSVISTLEAIPGRIHSIFNYVLGKNEKGVEMEIAEALFSPPLREVDPGETVSPGGMFKTVLGEAKKLQLVNEIDGKLYVSGEVAERVRKSGKSSWDFLVTEMEEILLDDFTAEERGQKSVPFAISWLLLQDPTNAPFFKDGQKEKVGSQLPGAPDAFELNAAARFQNLAYWGRFLGCCVWLQARGQVQIIPDPSALISRLLPELFQETNTMPISQFLAEIGQRRPALEGGRALNQVRDWATKEILPVGNSLLKSTSFALIRLAQRKEIQLIHLSDAETVTIFKNGADSKVSHIQFKQG